MAGSVRRFHPLGHSPPLLRRDLACVANFFSARRDQLAWLFKSDRRFDRRHCNRGNILSRTRSRHSSQSRTQVYVDLRKLGLVFNRPFFESARTNIGARDLDLRLRFNRACLCSIYQSVSGRGGVHHFISDRLDFGRCAIADSLALVANRFARRLDFRQRRIQQNRVAPADRAAVAWKKSVGRNRAAWSRVLDVANNARLVETCRRSQHLAFFAESRRCCIRRRVPSARRRSTWANIFVTSVKRRFPESCLRFARNARSRSTARSPLLSRAPTAPIASSISTPQFPLTEAAESFAMSFSILNTDAKSIFATWSRAGWWPRSTTNVFVNAPSMRLFLCRCIRRSRARAGLLKRHCSRNG